MSKEGNTDTGIKRKSIESLKDYLKKILELENYVEKKR